MSDLIVNVRQVSSYPNLAGSDGTENVLVQQGGLGGPYASISTANLVATALSGARALGVGVAPPSNADAGQIFSGEFVAPSDGALSWNAYTDTNSIWRLLNAGSAASIGWDPNTGLGFAISPVGGAGQTLTWVPQLTLSNAGSMGLPFGTLTVARDPAAQLEVATMGWVGKSTVASFNQRNGAVTLNAQDVYQALKLCDPIATQPWVQGAINASIQNLLYTCPFVTTWNGRQGQVYLMLSDITCVFYQSGQQPISPTPLPTSNDDSIATTKWVTDALISGTASLNVRDFGAVGDGTTDDTQALQAAVNAAAQTGGAVIIDRTTRLYIDGNVTIPLNVGLRGDYRFSIAVYNPGEDWYSFGSQIRLGSSGLIVLRAGSIERLMFIRAGLYPALPQNPADATSLVASFGGTGLSLPSASDVMIEACWFLGFTTGIDAPTASRLNVIDCRFDCTTGIACGNSSDISRYHRNHFLPFLTISIPGVGEAPLAYLPLQRSGAAMQMTNNTWDQLVDCFQFGWYQGFVCNNCSNPVFVNTHSDYTTPADNSVAGFQILGTTAYAKFVGCLVVSCNQGVIINASGSTLNPMVEIIGGNFIVHTIGVNVLAGGALIQGATFELGTVGIHYDTGTTTGTVIGCNFNGVGSAVGFVSGAVANLVQIIGNTFSNGTPAQNSTLTTPSLVVNGVIQGESNIIAAGGMIGGFVQAGGATWTTGVGAPSAAQAVGSLYSNTAGAVGSHLYVSAGGGTWNAVAGV